MKRACRALAVGLLAPLASVGAPAQALANASGGTSPSAPAASSVVAGDASDPTEAFEIDASERLDLYASPESPQPRARAEAWGLSRIRYEGFVRAASPALLLVWSKRTRAGRSWLEVRSPVSGPAWIRADRGKLLPFEKALKGKPLLLGKEWDRRAYSSPGSSDALELDDSPEILRFTSLLAIPPGLARDARLYSAPDEPLRSDADGPADAAEKPIAIAPKEWASTALSFERAPSAGASILVYESKGRWAKIRLRDRAPHFGRWAWIETGDDLPAPVEFESPASRESAIAANPELEQARHERDQRPGFQARLVRAETVRGRVWALVEAFRADLCDDEPPGRPAARGWIPLTSPERLTARINSCE